MVPSKNEEATEVTGATDTELRYFVSSNMYAKLYALYPDKKRLNSSQF